MSTDYINVLIITYDNSRAYTWGGTEMWVVFVVGIVIGIVVARCVFFLHFYQPKDLGKKFFEDI